MAEPEKNHPDPITLDYAQPSLGSHNLGRCRTPSAVVLAVLLGVAAGWLTDLSGYGAIIEMPFFAIIGAFCAGLLAKGGPIVIGFLFCLVMCATTQCLIIRLDAQSGEPWDIKRSLAFLASSFVITAVVSLSATVPLTVLKRSMRGDAISK